jgi:hypothetical protein
MVASAGLGALALSRQERPVAARVSGGVAIVAAASLVVTILGHDVGLFQRAGLTVIDLWFVAIAITILHNGSAAIA